MSHPVRKCAALALAIAATLTLWAGPASAHAGSGSAPATNYRVEVVGIDSDLEGVTVRSIEAGNRLELTTTSSELVVKGYEGEPYLKVGPDGAFVNRRSSTSYVNNSKGKQRIPKDADPTAEPEWIKTSDEQTVRWRDQRSKWTEDELPPEVRADPDRVQRVRTDWTIPFETEQKSFNIKGHLTWVPGPSPLPWFGVVAVLALVTYLAARSRLRVPTIAFFSAGLLLAVAVDLMGAWLASSEPFVVKAGNFGTALLPCVFLAVGVALIRRARETAFVLVMVGATWTVLSYALTTLDYLSNSQLPVKLEPVVARVSVAFALGVGTALALAFMLAWRDERRAIAELEYQLGVSTEGSTA